MKQIIDFFIPNTELSLFEKQKIKAFVISGLFGSFLVVLNAINKFVSYDNYDIITDNIVGFMIIIFVSINFAILKNYGMKYAGNFFSLGLIIILSGSITITADKSSILNNYISRYYFLFALLSISVLFASKLILVINSGIILLSVTKIYIFAKEISEDFVFMQSGYINYIIALSALTIILFLIMKFTELAIKSANKSAQIKEEQNNILLKMVAGIRDSSEQIYKASEQLSSSSQYISSNANEQAEATEKISSSMEQMLSMVSSNTENAKITEVITTKSADEIKQSKKAFFDTIKSVSNISNETTIITDIAFQTNILSLNASIEAVRAGKSGKGFYVVAKEVRKLAGKTKLASNEISKLSKIGQNVSKIAQDKLEKLIPEIIKSAEFVKNIVISSRKQQSGIELINNSIQQLGEIANENSASAEEMSVSAEELSAQAEQLKDLITGYPINKQVLN